MDPLDTETETISNTPSPREELVNLINSKREEQINSEILESGVTVAPLHAKEAIEELVDRQISDPLAPFIQLGEDGKPMFKMQVDGQEVLTPLEEVRTSQQLDRASRKRMEENANWAKNLAEREAEIRSQEAALQARLVQKPSSPQVDTDDRDFRNEAQEIFSTLIEDDADVASEKLAKVLSEINRTSQRTSVNPDEIVAKTLTAVTETLTAKERAKAEADLEQDFKDGLNQFREKYPEINNDPLLYGAANSLTNVIAKEHPDWKPSQIILEAGERTMEWAGQKRQPVLELSPEINDRQTRKDNLVVLPPSRSGVRQAPPEQGPQTPKNWLDEVRAARGQPA